MALHHRAAVFYDVDGTLVNSNIVYVYVYYALRLRGMGTRMRKVLRGLALAPVYTAAEVVNRTWFNRLFYANYRGVTEDSLIHLGREVAREVLLPNLYPEARARIEQAHRLGLTQVIVSGSLDHVLRPFAEALGIEHVIANRLEVHGGKATGKLLPPVVAGLHKKELVEQFAAREGIDLQHSYALADSRADLELLRAVGYPCAVNPDAILEKEARRGAWPILRFA